MGGGIAGLSIAYLLSQKSDIRIIILEKEEQTGGVLRGISAGENIHYPSTAFFMGLNSDSIFYSLLKKMNIPVDNIFHRETFIYSVLCNGKIFNLPSSVEDLKTILKKKFEDDIENINVLFKIFDAIHDELVKLYELDSKKVVFNFLRTFPGLVKYGKLLYLDFLNKYRIHNELRCILSSYLISSHQSLLNTVEYIYAANGGGTYSLQIPQREFLNQITKAVKSSGVSIYCNANIKKIEIDNQLVRSVHTSIGDFSGKVFICTLDPAFLPKLISDADTRSWYINKTQYMTRSSSYVSIILKKVKILQKCDNLIKYLPETDASEWFSNANGMQFLKQDSIYNVIYIHYPVDKTAINNLSNNVLNNNIQSYVKMAIRSCNQLAWINEDQCLYDIILPQDYEKYFSIQDGVTFGWEMTPAQSGKNIFPQQSICSNLFQTGQFTFPGGGVLASLHSASILAEKLLTVSS